MVWLGTASTELVLACDQELFVRGRRSDMQQRSVHRLIHSITAVQLGSSSTQLALACDQDQVP